MKESELRRRAKCSRCKQTLGHSGLPIFAVVRHQDYGVDIAAIQRQQGLGMMIGAELAMHMGPDEDLAKVVGNEADLTLCASCRLDFMEWLEGQ